MVKKAKDIYGLLFLRPLLVTFILFTAYPIFLEIPRLFYYIIFATIILTFIYLPLTKFLSSDLLLFIQFFIDSLIITAMVFVTGGEESLFPFLYALLIILASIYLGKRGALFVFIVSTIVYSFLLLYITQNKLLSTISILYRFYFFTTLFVAVTILSSILTEQLKRRSEEFSRVRLTTEEILKSLPMEILTIDHNGMVIFSNIHNSERIESIKRLLSQGDTKEREIKEGDRSYLFMSQSIINPENKLIGKLAILTDVTELRRLQEQSRIAERMKLLAELGASFAHEIRNPLASICGSVEILSGALKRNRRFSKLATLILKEAHRVNGIIRDFLEFARIKPAQREKIVLGELIGEAIQSLPQNLLLSKKINIIWDEKRKVWAWVDGERIKQVLLILLINAIEAIKDQGEIKINVIAGDREVVIEIKDNGVGIKREDLERIFDPFYSTKKGGTGLGLAIAERIITEHNGRIEVKSQVGKGSTFSVYLPVVQMG